MNKFKKVLLGALSVLTLGLFVVTGTKVNAATTDYYYWKNVSNSASNSTKLINSNDDTITLTGFTNSSTDSGRASSITTSLLPNGADIAVGDRALKVSSGSSGTFTTTFDFKFKSIVLYDSTSAGNIYLKKGETEIAHVEVPKQSDKVKKSFELSSSSTLTAGTYSVTGGSNLYFFEIVLEYEIPDYTIVYNNGEHGSSRDSASNVTALSSELLADLDDDGDWLFDGWYLDNTYSVAATTSTDLSEYADINGNVTLYANWIDANAVYNVTFMNGSAQYGDVISIPYDSNNVATLGDSMPNNPTKSGYIFDGWYTADGTNDVWGNLVTSSTEITASMVSNKAITLYAKYSVDPVINATFDNYTGFSSLPTSNISESISDVVVNSYLTVPGNIDYFVKAKTNKTTFNDNVTLTNQVQAKRLILTLNTISKVDIYAQQTGSNTRTLKVINSAKSTVVGSFIPEGTSNKNVFTIYLAPGTYYLDGYQGDDLNNLNFSGVIIDTSKKLSDNVLSEMHTQYNNNTPALADKLRLIGYIDGITDVADITSITINATVTRSSDSKVATLSYSINKLFQSFNDDYTATNGRYYAVVIINDIDDLIADTTNDYTLSTLSITVTFDDTSSVTSNGFTSFKIGE